MLKRIIVVFLIIVALAACGNQSSVSKEKNAEQTRQDQSVARILEQQPAHAMTYSPTRATINKWIDTWNDRSRLAYVYITNDNGDAKHYLVLKGPPVSSCVAISPTSHLYKSDNGNLLVPNPGIDAAWYSGAQCLMYDGIDASTGQMVEFSVGVGQQMWLTTQPLTQFSSATRIHP